MPQKSYICIQLEILMVFENLRLIAETYVWAICSVFEKTNFAKNVVFDSAQRPKIRHFDKMSKLRFSTYCTEYTPGIYVREFEIATLALS